MTDVQYVTCRAQMCTEANRNYPFPEYIDISSLVVQDDYIFIQVRRSLMCGQQSRRTNCIKFVLNTKLALFHVNLKK